jgi:hypothetical protein
VADGVDTRCTTGGICKLRELIEEHPAELAYDFRIRFHLGLDDIGQAIPWLETLYLISVLLRDPSSWLQAARNEWAYPVDRNWILASQTYDLLAMVNSKKKPKPYPTPWPDPNTNKLRPKTPQNRSEVLKRLRRMNPKD